MTQEPNQTDAADTSTVIIDHLGGGGDGVAMVGDERWFVAGALAGETVRARPIARNREGMHAEIERVEQPLADRVTPPCRHFAAAAAPCGGCSLQHLAAGPYRDFKRGLIVHALEQRGLSAVGGVVQDPLVSPEGARRRVTLTAIGTQQGAVLGFHQRRSKRVVDLAECVIAVPAVTAALPPLRAVLGDYLRAGERASVALVATDSGPSIELSGPARYPQRRVRAALSAVAEALDACRVVWRKSARQAFMPLVERRPARQHFAEVAVDLPAGAFLQATAAGEAVIRDEVWTALAGLEAVSVADLYAGCGSIALPIAAAGHAVHAVEGARDPLCALAQAGEAAGLAVTTERRDLAARPLSVRELAAFDSVVFDPPRAGARELARELAQAPLVKIVAVSCHPGTFARDARTLVDGGYRLERVQPIDQFLYSSHVELVAVFRRC